MKSSTDMDSIKLRAYTVVELDELRYVCKMRWLFGTTNIRNGGMGRQYQGSEKDNGVEELVRTHMLAGHVAKDLIDADASSDPEGTKSDSATGVSNPKS